MGHSREEILSLLREGEVAAVATVAGDKMRTRMMHFAVEDDFTLYLSSVKGDPKILHMTHHPSVSILFCDKSGKPGQEFPDAKEVEVTGIPVLIRDDAEKKHAQQLLVQKSPVVKYFVDSGNAEALDYFKIIPQQVKFRWVREVLQGIPPTVIDFPGTQVVVNEWALLRRKLGNWLRSVRYPFLTASLVPLLLGAAVAWADTAHFTWGYFLLTLVAGLALQAGVNVINDYFDHKSGNDEVNLEYVRPFSGGSRMIQLGLLSPVEVLGQALFLFLLASGIGIYLAWTRGPLILLLGIVGILSGFFYTGYPFYWAKRGLGELLVGLNFGPLMALGAYYVQSQSFSWTPFVAAIPVGLLIANVLYINEFQDYQADKAVGKTTWVVRLGRQRGVMLFAALMVATYLALALGTAFGILPLASLLALLALPLSLRAILHARRYHGQPLDLSPANALTITSHLAVGLALVLAFIWAGLAGARVGFIGFSSLAVLLLVVYWYRDIDRQRRAFHGLKGVVAK